MKCQAGRRTSWNQDCQEMAMGNLELTNAPTSPCNHHIDAAYVCYMYYQLSNPFCLYPGQQATDAVPVQQGYIKLQLATENITHLYVDTTIRTMRLETSKRGRPNALCHPSSTGSNQKDLTAPFPKESGLPSLKGEC